MKEREKRVKRKKERERERGTGITAGIRDALSSEVIYLSLLCTSRLEGDYTNWQGQQID